MPRGVIQWISEKKRWCSIPRHYYEVNFSGALHENGVNIAGKGLSFGLPDRRLCRYRRRVRRWWQTGAGSTRRLTVSRVNGRSTSFRKSLHHRWQEGCNPQNNSPWRARARYHGHKSRRLMPAALLINVRMANKLPKNSLLTNFTANGCVCGKKD